VGRWINPNFPPGARGYIYQMRCTSGNVYPAAGLVLSVPPAAHTLEINLEPSEASGRFLEHRRGRAADRVPEWVRERLADSGL